MEVTCQFYLLYKLYLYNVLRKRKRPYTFETVLVSCTPPLFLPNTPIKYHDYSFTKVLLLSFKELLKKSFNTAYPSNFTNISCEQYTQ